MSNKFLDDAGVIYLFSKVKERDYQSDFELGYYDTITENDDESYTITRQTGYLTYKSSDLGYVGTSSNGLAYFNIDLPFNYNYGGFISNIKYTTNPDIAWDSTEDIVVIANTGAVGDRRIYYKQGRTEPIYIQYKLATATTEKVEKNHYARYNQRFILEHNKSEAERSANVFNIDDINSTYAVKISDIEFKATSANYELFKTNFKENTQYTISGYTKNDSNLGNHRFTIVYTDGTKSNSVLMNNTTSYKYGTFTTDKNKTIAYISVDYSNNGNDYIYCKDLMLNEGTIALPYQPYEGKVVHEKEIDSSLSSTSTNPVQNKVINSALDGKANKTDITDMAYVVDSSDNAVSLETYGTEGYYVVPTKTYVDTQLTDKQDKLVSGTNIKTINGSTILGSGDITISGGNGGNVGTDPSFNSVIVEQTGAENTGVKLYANRQGDLYSIKRADTSVNRKILTNSDIDPSKVVLTNKQQKISAVTLFESLYVGSDYWKASITASSNSSSQYYMILSANAGEFHFECPAKYNLKLITNQLTRHTTIYAPSKDGTIALLSDIPTIYGITQLYKHDYELENQVGDTIYVTCWSTQNTKIPLCDITRYAFSNVQVYNSSSEETIQVIKWGTSGFRFINDSGNIDGNSYTVINYYIDGEPTTY